MNWDEYFYGICVKVAENSKCLSRKIGAILVKDNIIISTGYSGPPRGVPSCKDRYLTDMNLNNKLSELYDENTDFDPNVCPRRMLRFPSGEGMEWCVSIHAEKNCLLSAARMGICTKGATLYSNMTITPCNQCFGALLNAGIKEVVCVDINIYDVSVKWLMQNSDMVIRKFEI